MSNDFLRQARPALLVALAIALIGGVVVGATDAGTAAVAGVVALAVAVGATVLGWQDAKFKTAQQQAESKAAQPPVA